MYREPEHILWSCPYKFCGLPYACRWHRLQKLSKQPKEQLPQSLNVSTTADTIFIGHLTALRKGSIEVRLDVVHCCAIGHKAAIFEMMIK